MRVGAGAELLAQLEGAWRIVRRIEDRRAGQVGSLEGEAAFEPEGEDVLYREAGLLRMGLAAPMRAERRYRWSAAGDRIAVRFDDGRPFHDIDARRARARAHHHCAPDDYAVAYTFDLPRRWEADWEVTGPRKDYRMVTEYRRL